MRRICLILLTVMFLLWQNFSIQATEEAIVCTTLPQAFEGLKIVQISDLHGRDMGRDHSNLLKVVEEAAPHLICITGDLFGNEEEWERILPLLPRLCTLAPTYYVTGNHEWQTPNLKEKLEQMTAIGICVLGNTYRVLEKEGQKIVIAGVHDPCGPYDQKTPEALMAEIRREEGEAFVLMLDHRNDRLAMWDPLGADLVLSGHAHGGVIRLPFAGGIFGPGRELFPTYDKGLFEEKEGTTLYVSGGLGYSRFKLRLFNRPHLPILTLKGK